MEFGEALKKIATTKVKCLFNRTALTHLLKFSYKKELSSSGKSFQNITTEEFILDEGAGWIIKVVIVFEKATIHTTRLDFVENRTYFTVGDSCIELKKVQSTQVLAKFIHALKLVA